MSSAAKCLQTVNRIEHTFPDIYSNGSNYITTSLEIIVKTRLSHKSVNATGNSSFTENLNELK